MNSKGIELAISTLIAIALGVLVLAALSYVLTDGFKQFRGSSEPILNTAESVAVREACNLACTAGSTYDFCCRKHNLDGQNTTCMDTRLGLECDISCAAVQCSAG